MFTVVQF